MNLVLIWTMLKKSEVGEHLTDILLITRRYFLLTKPGVEVNKLLQEIIDVEAYKKDYEDITMKMLFEEVDYETAVSKLQQVVNSGLFE